jgi:HAD superfamily hydrolase (TIGR01509 family)
MNIRGIIFDLDGTITQPYFDFMTIREEMGLGADAGPVWEAMLAMGPEERRRADSILEKYEKEAIIASKLNEGTARTLEEIRESGIKTAILTRNNEKNTRAVVAMHGLEFDLIVTREHGPVKPDAFGVNYICDHWHIEPDRAMVVGDYLFDLQCAHAAGAYAVLFKSHKDSDEFVYEADFVIEKMPEMLNIISDLERVGEA